MAAPHIAGLISAIISMAPELTYDEVINMLTTYADEPTTDVNKPIGKISRMHLIMEQLGVVST